MEGLTPRDASPSIGATIAGRYRIVGALDRPGGSELFVGLDLELHRPVALKVLSLEDEAELDGELARLAREARRLATMRHPNIAQLLDHGEDAGRYYLVQEFVEGPRLGEVLRSKGTLRLPEFVPIAADVLRAVGFANAHGVMVRDVGLDAFALHETAQGSTIVKLIDLRLARLEDDSDRITRHGIVGAATYLAPEQVVGATQDVRIDVYAIGVLFYQLLSGRTPQQADNLATLLYKKVHERPTPLREVLPSGHDVPDDLAALVDECMAIAPGDRPSTADLVLERVIDVVPSALLRLPKPRRSKPAPRVASRPRRLVNAPTEPFAELSMEPLDIGHPTALRTDDAIPSERHDAGETIPDGALHLGPAQQVTLSTTAVPIERRARRLWVAASGLAVSLAIVGGVAWLEPSKTSPERPAALVRPPAERPSIAEASPPAPATVPIEQAVPDPGISTAPSEPPPLEFVVSEPSRRKARSSSRPRSKPTATPEPPLRTSTPVSEPPPDEFGKLRRKGLKAFD